MSNGVPNRFRIVAQARISAKMRDKIKTHVQPLGVRECDIWSGAEFEEFLRERAESVLKRFAGGEVFPDAPEDLRNLAASVHPVNDDEVLALFARLFDRPAFYTPIHQESNLGDFKQAITDTIQALGTGIWKAGYGLVIDRIPSRHQLKSATLRTKIQTVEKALSGSTKYRAFPSMKAIDVGFGVTLFRLSALLRNLTAYFAPGGSNVGFGP